jgi:fatty acid synthase
LKANEKNKINNGAPTDSLPRLVVWSGRTEEAVNNVFDYIEQGPLNAEFIGLLHSTQNDSYWKNTYRGYAVFKHESEKNAICLSRNVQERNSGQKLPIVWVFPGAGSQWPTMGKSFLEIPIIRNSVEHCHDVLTSKGINLMEIITCEDPNVFDNILNTFVGIVAIQIGIVDVLRELGIEPDYIIGHSFGEIVCAYADGCFTQEQAILAAYYRGMAFNERRIIKGSMAVVGLSAEELELILPEDIYIACYNTENLCTISGPAESIKNFVEELESKKIHATEVKTSGVAAHSRYIYDAGELYHSYLRDIIVDAKERSAKWLSSCIPKAECYRDDLAYSSPKYHSKNFSNPVLFYQASKQLPPNCLTIEIAPQQIFQSILKSNAPNGVHVGFSKREDASNVLNVLGE